MTVPVPLECARDHVARGRHLTDPCEAADCDGCAPALAEVGVLCRSCAARIHWALAECPDLAAHIRVQLVPDAVLAADRERVSGSSTSRLPLRAGALEDGDLLYASLAGWCTYYARELRLLPPRTVQVYFEADVDVRGIPAGFSPEQAYDLARSVVGFLTKHEALVAHHQSVPAFHDDLVPLVGRLRHRYGLSRSTSRRYRPRSCPLCGHEEVRVHWPTASGDDLVVKCDHCWHVIPLPDSLVVL